MPVEEWPADLRSKIEIEAAPAQGEALCRMCAAGIDFRPDTSHPCLADDQRG